ncbi:tetratricopeptide repeat protein [Nitrosomonas mobilis]|uniref:protein O-GlcNAc transferase n=1 Tax=Nitrosomonas mobilis TaxID=51642 RepID=A0A1G5SJL8_9PROT|nr:tetratricopeptide repeat protein [Nitrosomonas mobilis]SCZ87080.1 TPR repeat-containing protein [Nitrosomonas mobilis]
MIITEQEHSDQQEKNSPAVSHAKKPVQSNKKKNSPNAAALKQLTNDFNQGLLTEAKALATNLTQTFPKHGMAWKVLGVIYHHEQHMAKAGEALKKAVTLMRKDAEVHYNLANFYCDIDHLEAAKASYQKSIRLAPDLAKAHFNLAYVLKDLKRFASAEASFKKGLKIEPRHAKIHFHLGQCQYAQKRFKEGLKSYQKSLQMGVNDVDLYLHLALSHRALGDLGQAEQSCRKALVIDPQHAGAYSHLAIILSEQGHLQEAEAACLRAIELDAGYVAAHNNLGLLYRDMEKPKEAEACYRKALSIQPSSVETLSSMAALLLSQYRYVEAETYCRQALALDTTRSDVWNNLGLILQARKLGEESQEAFEEALALQPDNPGMLSNYSVTLRMVGKSSEAEAVLRKATKLDDGHANAYLNLGNVYLDQGLVEKAIEAAKQGMMLAPERLGAYSNLLYSTTCSEQYCPEFQLKFAREFGCIVSQKADQKFNTWLVSPKDKRLRVGVVSGDLRQHPVAYFLKNVIQHINSSKITLVAYLTDGRVDSVSGELRPYFAEWKSLAGQNDQSTAEMIHADGIHVLLDLSGHTAGNRLSIFAWQPAPVQATWLGYWSTTGVAEIDYCLTDEISLPPSCQTQFTEKIRYLPNTRLCFSEPEIAAEVAPLPAMRNGFVTFGCYQQLAKVGDTVMQLWGRVMQAIPNARLRWQCKSFIDEAIIAEVKRRLQKNGVEIERIRLLGQASREAYFVSYAEVDMNLDSFPFTGGTTTCDALWMGVPTLTLIGNTMIARQGASLMTAAGLPDWVAMNQAEYVEKAISLSTDLTGLAALRSDLRARLKTSPLFDGARFARHFETALQEMWQEKCTILAKKFVKDTQSSTDAQNPAQNGNQRNVATAIEIVSATRMSEQDFWQQSALGQSLARHLTQGAKFKINVAYENTLGLSEVFNAAIAQAEDDAVLVFVHDDVWLDEADIAQAILNGLDKFDVIGVAGNKRRLPRQPAWCFLDTQFTCDTHDNLSGKVAHGQSAYGKVSEYGDVPAECELIDGLFLAARKQTLIARQVTFDPQFDFHFYDLDFCRTARNAGLRLGTWPIQLTHQSGGAFGTPAWQKKYQQYLEKWDEADDFDAMYEQAHAYEQQGEIVAAARLYHVILEHRPRHPEVNHRLGFIEAHTLGAETALPRFEVAVMAKPGVEQFWVSYIDALMMAGRIDEGHSAIKRGLQSGLTAETAEKLTAEFTKKEQALNVADIRYSESNNELARAFEQMLKCNMDDIQMSIQTGQPISPHVDAASFEGIISKFECAGLKDEILALIFKVTASIKLMSDFVGHKIYIPYFDQILQELDLEIKDIVPRSNKSANVVIATEMYDFGGHTKVIKEIVETVENPIVIITDIYNRFARNNMFTKVASQFSQCPIFILPTDNYINNALRIAKLINSYAKNVFLLSHHDDSVAIAACQKNLDVNYYFIHHADHNPALGSHIKHLRHVDLFEERAKLCYEDLQVDTQLLPTTATDQGQKLFEYPVQGYSTVTAGSFGKFSMTGPLSLPDIIIESLKVTDGRHYHFGDIPDEQLAHISQAIESAGCNPHQFIYKGNVASLWQALLEIDAHIYIGSAPIIGAKSAIEAQGVGYALLAYNQENRPRHLNIGGHNSDTVYWSNIESLREGLWKVMVNHAYYSNAAKAFYASNCTVKKLQETLRVLGQ